jgi:ABC-type lipoprotein release transport system permease subunit
VAGLIAGLVLVTTGLDRATFTYSAALMLLAAAGACTVPARRAGRVDPAGF